MAENLKSPTPLAEITHGPSGFEQFLENNQKGLIVALIAAILGILGWIVFRGISESKALSASHALYEAEDIPSLEAVKLAHPDTPSGGTASLLLANRQATANDTQAAIETLKGFLADSKEHPGTPAATAALAAKLMNQGDSAAAAEKFSEIIDDPKAGYLAPYALLCLGDMAASGGDTGKAEQYYQQAKNDYPGSAFQMRISQRIAALNAALPAEIDAPAEPLEPPTLEVPMIRKPGLPVGDPGDGGASPPNTNPAPTGGAELSPTALPEPSTGGATPPASAPSE